MNDELKDIIYSDLFRYTGNTKRHKNVFFTYIEEMRTSPEFHYISNMRHCSYHYSKTQTKINDFKYFYHKFLLSLCSRALDRKSRKYHFQIPYETKIDKGFYIAHFGRIIIHPKAVIGNNVNVSTGVVIGTQFRGSRKGSPHIGNYVWIGANAVIVGKINIGNNVLIAPGAYVNFDVPDNSIVIGNPGLIRQSPGATLGYINNTILFDEYNVRSGDA